MKTAVFIRDGVTQVVLTPETDLEKSVVNIVQKKVWPETGSATARAVLFRGSFYECSGGWNRQGEGDDSLIIRVDAALPEIVRDIHAA